MKQKLIELWKTNCEHCEAVKPIYELGYIYTPAFINPQVQTVLSFNDREPTKAELIQLAEGGEPK